MIGGKEASSIIEIARFMDNRQERYPELVFLEVEWAGGMTDCVYYT